MLTTLHTLSLLAAFVDRQIIITAGIIGLLIRHLNIKFRVQRNVNNTEFQRE